MLAPQGGTSILGGRGEGLGPHIKFGGKIWGKVRPSSPNKKKKLGKFCHHKTQNLGKNPNFGVISEIQRAKFGVFVTYIFGGKILGSNKNFRGKFWGQAPPRSLNMKVPPLGLAPNLLAKNIIRISKPEHAYIMAITQCICVACSKLCSINFEPPDVDLCSECHVYPISGGASIISILFIVNSFTWELN